LIKFLKSVSLFDVTIVSNAAIHCKRYFEIFLGFFVFFSDQKMIKNNSKKFHFSACVLHCKRYNEHINSRQRDTEMNDTS